MVTGRQSDFERADFVSLPVMEFLNDLKTQIMHQVSDLKRHYELVDQRRPPGAFSGPDDQSAHG